MHSKIEAVPLARQMTGYFSTYLARYGMKAIRTSGAIDDALWSALEYYSEVEEVGIDLLIKKGVAKRDTLNTFKRFRSYVRQAKSYYYSAMSLHYRSASLLYYYCFLNLAKAGLLIRQPTITSRKLLHGLSLDIDRNFTTFDEVVIKFMKDSPRTPLDQRRQVFPLLYEIYFGKPLVLDVANVTRLLGYISDVSQEYELCKYGERKLFFAVSTTAMNATHKTTWPLVGIHDGGRLLKYKKSFKDFNNDLERVELGKQIAREIWGMDAAVMDWYVFYQGRNPKPWISDNVPFLSGTLGQEVIGTLGSMFQSNVYSEKTDFFVASPYSHNRQEPMNETLAIYLVMYYLGSLVRYKPEYLEELISKKESWLIESFVKSTPVTFLRQFIPWIIEFEYRLAIR